MNQSYSYGPRHHYPHMKPADVAIWEEFIEQNPKAYETAIYDQAVGEGAEIPEGTQDNMARDFKILTQWKIDVVGFFQDQIHIIELKPNAGISALGQVLGYANLFKKTFKPVGTVTPVVITDRLRPDMLALAKEMGVKIYATKLG